MMNNTKNEKNCQKNFIKQKKKHKLYPIKSLQPTQNKINLKFIQFKYKLKFIQTINQNNSINKN